MTVTFLNKHDEIGTMCTESSHRGTMKTDEETVFAFVVDYRDKFCCRCCANNSDCKEKCGAVRNKVTIVDFLGGI